ARATLSTTRPASFIQCNAALLKTASNSPANVMSEALSSTTLIPRRRPATQNSRLESSPTTRQPTSAIFFVSTPSPQPTSRMLSPGCGARSSNTGAPRSVTKRAFLAYPSAFQVCDDISGTSCFSNCTQCQWKRYEPAVNDGKPRTLHFAGYVVCDFNISDKSTYQELEWVGKPAALHASNRASSVNEREILFLQRNDQTRVV